MQNDKLQYLIMLQSIITRMASNCFVIKNWFFITLSALTAFFYKTKGDVVFWDNQIIFILAIIILFFGSFDFYYLHLERKFRQKFNDGVNNKAKPFDMNIESLSNRPSVCKTLGSISLAYYYFIAILLLLIFIY